MFFKYTNAQSMDTTRGMWGKSVTLPLCGATMPLRVPALSNQTFDLCCVIILSSIFLAQESSFYSKKNP